MFGRATRFVNVGKVQLEYLESRRLLAGVALGPPVTTPLGPVGRVAAGDVNGDGRADLIAFAGANATTAAPALRVYLGHGNGKFAPQPVAALPVGAFVSSIVTADFDRDGRLDIACAVGPVNATNVRVFLGNGDGTFNSADGAYGGEAPHQLAAGDLNGDGNPDLVAANREAWTLPGTDAPPTYGAGVLLGNGDGTFQPVRKIDVNHPQTAVALGDVNADHRLDVALAGPFLLSLSPLPTGAVTLARAVAVTSPNTAGFSTQLLGLLPGHINGVAMGDVNGDLRADVAAVRSFPRATTSNIPGDATVHLFLGLATSSNAPPPSLQFPLAMTRAAGISMADFDGDARADVAVAGLRVRATLAPSLGIAEAGHVIAGDDVPALLSPTPTPTPNAVSPGVVAVISRISTVLPVIPPVQYFHAGPAPIGQALADLNHDSRPDLVLGSASGATGLLNATAHMRPMPATQDLHDEELSQLIDFS